MPDAQPNILLIMTDEHTPFVSGAYGDPVAQTPHIDRLANTGVTFESCYCNSPLCVPSRLSMTAGRYPSRIGAWSNGSMKWKPQALLDAIGRDTLHRRLSAAGYDTVLCGRINYDGDGQFGARQIGPPWKGRLHVDNADPPTGLAKDQRMSPEFTPDVRAARDKARRRREAPMPTWSKNLDYDRAVTRSACEFLQGWRADDGPFFLSVGFFSPHGPFIVPDDYWQPFRERVTAPTVPPGHLERLPWNYQLQRECMLAASLSDEDIRLEIARYYGLTKWIDEQIGQVLEALAATPLANDTVVIYASDHGDNLHRHGMTNKSTMYEFSVRVPLIISWPQRWDGGQRRAQACSLVDLTATIAELGGVEPPTTWDGDSMLGWLDDGTTPWKDMAVSEFHAHRIASGIHMLRRGDYKYIYHAAADEDHPPQRELFNLARDPEEMTNLAEHDSHAPQLEDLHQRLVAELGIEPDALEQQFRAEWLQVAETCAGALGNDATAARPG